MPQDQTQLQKIGLMLGATGAGLQGNLAQWNSVQQQGEYQRGLLEQRQQQHQMQQKQMQAQQQMQNAEMEKQRQITAFTDAKAAQSLIEQGDFGGVFQLGLNRLMNLKYFPGVDPSDTQRITQLARIAAEGGPDSEQAKQELANEIDNTVRLGNAYKIYDQDRATEKDASGRLRYLDDQSYVFDDVEEGAGKDVHASAVTDTYPDGTVLQSLSDGTTVVRNSQGDAVEGQERTDVLRDALQSRIDEAQAVSGARTAGTKNMETAFQALKDLGPVKASIANIDRGLEALEDGAKSGFIESKLPAMDEATINLRNSGKRMGLDILAQGSFGTLSEGEIKLVMEVAQPGLSEEALTRHLQDKKAVQLKMATMLEDLAMHFSEPGADIADWIEKQKSIAEERVDSQGNSFDVANYIPSSADGVAEGTLSSVVNGVQLIVRDGKWEIK